MRHRSTALPLALCAAALVLYASLYPFEGWRWPPGHDVLAVAALPWPTYSSRFDDWTNALGYLPLGALVYGAGVRSGSRTLAALLAAVLLPTLLSASV